MNSEFRRCTRCVLDKEGPHSIQFREDGVCSYCDTWDRESRGVSASPEKAGLQLKALVAEIHKGGAGRSYDSVLGVSGGVDSTYAAYQAKQLGLRPLVVHLDNGWNSELAVQNIENVCRKLGFDLYTHVVDWAEFKDLHVAYLRASVIDVEVPTDHAITALLVHIAVKRRVRFVLTGITRATEGILPCEWVWDKMDLLNLQAIHRRYGSRPLLTFPQLGFFRYTMYQQLWGVRWVNLLDYIVYD